jgi:phosphohistidine phosphatase SixA
MAPIHACRHAESEADKPGVRDHDRNISDAGTRAAQAVACHLRDSAWLPDLLLCSNSKRTRQTVEAMAEEVPAFGDVDSHFLGTLYTIAALDGMTRSHLAMRVRYLLVCIVPCCVATLDSHRDQQLVAHACCSVPA